MLEVTIVANESEFSKGEEMRLQYLADTWRIEDKCTIRDVMHRFGMRENLSVSVYGNSEEGFTLNCHKTAISPKVATA